ncbi:hypothetical protein OCOJLMKI_4684 [Methylobacterium iners]|uniref:HEPN domain-containing protein n=2 Tax=Methylobacterium iners TaxID=418707 RepID=A0ABQ4S4P5_9HYPH|nr:hypothetical protein OCOJLMKI_4684 [Methylobacterium iners]
MTDAARAKDDARLFALDALREARRIYAGAGNPASGPDAYYLATFALLACAALFPELTVEETPCSRSASA